MSVVTSSYRTFNASNFVTDVENNDYYVFVSSVESTRTRNSEFSKTELLEKTLFGKKITAENLFFLIDNNRWVSGTVYDQYDDAVDLSDRKFYVVVYPDDTETGGEYRVFKCLFNNSYIPDTSSGIRVGRKSISAPSYDPDMTDQVYRMVETETGDDGYIWKYMFSISAVDFERYRVLSYVPVIESANTVPAIDKRSISHIEVVNNETNKGYDFVEGTVNVVSETLITLDISVGTLSEITNYYSDQNFYVIDSNNVGYVYTIDTYEYVNSRQAKISLKETINLTSPSSPIKTDADFQIFPRIEIKGDGEGAAAIPVLDTLGTIKSVIMLNKGSGYTNAAARVVNPIFGFNTTAVGSLDEEAILRPILSPEGGHGTNIPEELKSRRILVYTTLTDTDNLSIPSTNVYTKVGIVKNPDFIDDGDANTAIFVPDIFDNRIRLELSSNILTVDEIVTQTDPSTAEVSFSAKVHEVSGNTVFLTSYHGPYQNTANTEIGYPDISLRFDLPIISSQNQSLSINKDIFNEPLVERPLYVQKTGEVYYMTNFSPITRTSTSNEEYKIVLEF